MTGRSSSRRSSAPCATQASMLTPSVSPAVTGELGTVWLEDAEHAAVDVDDLAVHEVGRRTGQEDERANEVAHVAPAAGRGAAGDPTAEDRVVDERSGQLGREVARTDRVDLDAAA